MPNNKNKNVVIINRRFDSDNTTQLFHNIIKEIIRSQPRANMVHKDSITVHSKPESYKERSKLRNDHKRLFNNHKQFQKSIFEGNITQSNFKSNLKGQEDKGRDLTFSFLQELEENSMFNDENNEKTIKNTKQITSNESIYNLTQKIDTVDMWYDTTTQQSIFPMKSIPDDTSIVSIKHFQPGLMSTPKKKIYTCKEKPKEITKLNDFSMLKNKVHMINKLNCNKKQKPTQNRVFKNKSLSYRLFRAINDSYINVVDKVKNIFKCNKDSSRSKDIISHSESNVKEKGFCNYSFTQYMYERDARLTGNQIWSKNNLSRKTVSVVGDFCRTCDNTAELKEKMKNNKYLKHTIQKLTLGINLYGCDFKVDILY